MISLSVLLGIAVLGIAVIGAFLLRTSIALDAATDLLEQQQQRIEQQDRFLDAAAARVQAGSGSTAEEVILALGRGFVTTVWGDASEGCQREALGCVSSGDPYVIHLDAAGFAQPYRTSWGATLVAHHEFAHILQLTHPEATDVALPAFGDDPEVMADCYALTATDSWTLDERVWQGSSAYWDVSYGYGTVCNGAQRSARGSPRPASATSRSPNS